MPDSAPTHDPYAALRERNYRFFAGGWVFASCGLQMQGTAIAWEIYEKTGDPLALGIAGLARALPVVLLALPAGRIVDLIDRRHVLIATQIAFAIAGGLLALGSYIGVTVWVMYALVALTGMARVFNGPSRSSLLPLIVKPENFHNAITWNSGVFQTSALLGPLAAGTIIYATGAAWPVYLIAAATCLLFACTCVGIRPRPSTVGQSATWRDLTPAALIPGMAEGIRHIRRERTVLGVISLDLFAVMLGGATALMPVFAKDILNAGPIGLGALRAAPYLGALVMALILAHRPPFQRAGPTLLWAVAIFGVATIAFGFSTNLWLSVALLAIAGAVDNISVVVRHVLVAVRTPDELRGRVSAVNSVFIESSNEVGGFFSGAAARLFGPIASVVGGGIGTLLVVAGIAWLIPEVRRLGRLESPR